MSGATAFRCSNISAFVSAVAGEMVEPGRVGAAEDSRLDQPPRVVWVPVERSGLIRECVNTERYGALQVYRERSTQWAIHLRGKDEAEARTLEAKFFNALFALGASEPAVEIADGDERPGSVAAEQGYLIIWRIRVWEPLVVERYVQGHIETSSIGVAVNDASNTIEAPPS